MDLIATKRCFYRTWRQPGEKFTADRARARALLQMKVAKIAPVTAPATYSHRAITQTRRVDMQAAVMEGKVTPNQVRAELGMSPIEPTDELKQARADYTAATGKRFFPGWTAEQLREKIAAHESSDD